MDKSFYEYVLKYPKGFEVDGVDVGGIVFYVGKGTVATSPWQAYERIDQHEAEARNGCECKKCGVILSIWERGMQVDKAKILESNSEAEVLASEEKDIKETYSSSYLTNFTFNRPEKTYKPETDTQRKRRIIVQRLLSNIVRGASTRKSALTEYDGYAWSIKKTAEWLSDDAKHHARDYEVVVSSNLPEPIRVWEERIYEPSSFNLKVFEHMPAKIEGDSEVYFNTKTACNFTGVGRQGLRFLDLAEEFGLSVFKGRVVAYYAKSELLKFTDWVNEKYPGESINPNFTEPEAPYGKQRHPSRHYQ